MTEREWDQKLHIDTIGRDATAEDAYHHPYEPTPYSVLVRLTDSAYINEENIVVDYGCGKGRVGFFLAVQMGCKVIGIEFDEKIYEQTLANLSGFVGHREKVEFLCVGAENYEIEEADVFYFFNPFSIEILRSVIGKIKKSYYNNPREMKLFFYYPSDEYISYLMTVPELCFLDEIDCSDLFENNKNREKIMIFEMM